MKSILIVFVVGLLSQQITRAQGTITYLSSLGQSSAGSKPVGSDSWLAASFKTGTNANGYVLDSIQLAMKDASGNPSGFTVMLYSAIGQGDVSPGSSLGTLTGSLNPAATAIYTYTPALSLTLSAHTAYFIVLTAGTAVANGAYEWSLPSPVSYSPIGGWQAPVWLTYFDNYQSSDGSSWNSPFFFPQFAIEATAVPEPSVLGLVGLGGLGFLWHRRRAKALLSGVARRSKWCRKRCRSWSG